MNRDANPRRTNSRAIASVDNRPSGFAGFGFDFC
jgi:hypothetical protein